MASEMESLKVAVLMKLIKLMKSRNRRGLSVQEVCVDFEPRPDPAGVRRERVSKERAAVTFDSEAST